MLCPRSFLILPIHRIPDGSPRLIYGGGLRPIFRSLHSGFYGIWLFHFIFINLFTVGVD